MTCWASVDRHARVAGDDRREDSSSQLKCPSPGNRECHSGCRYYDQNGDRGCEHRDPGCEPCDERISRALRAPYRAGTVGIAGRKSMGIELSSKGKMRRKSTLELRLFCEVTLTSALRTGREPAGRARGRRVAHEGPQAGHGAPPCRWSEAARGFITLLGSTMAACRSRRGWKHRRTGRPRPRDSVAEAQSRRSSDVVVLEKGVRQSAIEL
jgi:hypothetical protein